MELEDVSTYEPPEILDDMDEDVIHARMLAIIPDNIDKTEGGFVYDFTMPAATEKADAMVRINEAVKKLFPEWSDDIFLDLLARDVGLTRRNATAAETTLTVTLAQDNTNDIYIPEGFVFSTSATLISENVLFVSTQAVTIPSGQTGTVPVVCSVTGIVGNVPANSIVLQIEPIAGIDTVTNPSAAVGGTETESDEDLKERIIAVDRSGDISYVGCDSDYIRWAQEIDGVGSVVVIPEWQGPGTGTVKLIVMDSNGQPASNTILSNVYNHIMAPSDPATRLANTEVNLTVVTATQLSLTVTATVTLDDDATMTDVKAEFTSRLRTYFEQAKNEGVLIYTRIGRELSETSGVVDYSALLVNGAASNVTIDADKYPVISSITLTSA